MEQYEKLKSFLKESKARKQLPIQEAAQIGDLLDAVFQRMARRSIPASEGGKLYSGLCAVDEIVGGLEPGELTAINGWRGSGRTALALHYALHTAQKSKKPVLIYSQHHSVYQITKRLLSMLTGVPICSIESGKLSEEQWNCLHTAGRLLKEQQIGVYDLSTVPADLCSILQSDRVPALWILDGDIGLIPEPAILGELEQLAKEKQCCVIFVGCHHSAVPYIQGNADKVLELYNLEDNEYGFELVWNRHGGTGSQSLCWNEACLCFMDPPGL